MLPSFSRQLCCYPVFSCKRALIAISCALLFLFSSVAATEARNVILFVADGFRQGSVNSDDAPTMDLIRKKGVFFENSHSLFPTLTTPNASAIAGNNSTPGTLEPNRVQQQYFVDTFTKAVLPLFAKDGKPFLAIFWSRDPDGTQPCSVQSRARCH